MCDATDESEDKLKYYIDKDRLLYNKYTLSTVSFEEQFRLYSPVIINGEEYYDVTEASDELGISVNFILQNFGKDYKDYDIRSTKYEGNVTEDKQFPFESDKKFASKMYKKIKEIRNTNALKQLFFPYGISLIIKLKLV